MCFYLSACLPPWLGPRALGQMPLWWPSQEQRIEKVPAQPLSGHTHSRHLDSCISRGLGLRSLSVYFLTKTFFGIMNHPRVRSLAPLPWNPREVRPRVGVCEIQAQSLLSVGQWKDAISIQGTVLISTLLFHLGSPHDLIYKMQGRGTELGFQIKILSSYTNFLGTPLHISQSRMRNR